MTVINKGRTGNSMQSIGEVSPTPDLEAVLTVNDRPIKDVSGAPYTFIEEDRGKFLVVAEDVTLESGVFPADSELIFRMTADGAFSLIADTGVDIYQESNTAVSSITIPDGCVVRLKQFDTDVWFFSIISFSTNPSISKTSNFTAQNDTAYSNNGTITVTDPTPVANKGYIVHVIGGTSTIGGVGYTTGALVYRYYNGSSWVSKDYGAGGASGTFLSADAKTITVVNGLITSIV